MLYTIIAFIIVLVGSYIAFQALRVLLLSSWFIGWITGMFGLSLLATACILGGIAYEIYSYKQIMVDQKIATIHFEIIEKQYYDAVIVDADGKSQRFSLHGDQWQVDARILKLQWKLLAQYDIKPAYRLDHISGRYYDIQKETVEKRSNFTVVKGVPYLDVWKFISENAKWFSILDAHYGTARYFPMKDGALFEISLNKVGLTVRPLNDAANKAVTEWEQ